MKFYQYFLSVTFVVLTVNQFVGRDDVQLEKQNVCRRNLNEGNGLCTSVHFKPTDSHSYLLYSSSHPSHVKNTIPYSQFLRLRCLCSDDSDFSLK